MNVFYLSCRRLSVVYKNITHVRLMSLAKPFSGKHNNLILIGLIPIIPTVSAQSLNTKDSKIENISNSKSDSKQEDIESDRLRSTFDDEKTPWERVKAIFETDEFGNFSKELTTVLNTSYMAMIVGLIYGGVQKSRLAYIDFMERNQASIFENHLDAKRKLQNHVTIHFGKGAFQWAWRMTAFTGGFMLMFLSLHAYRGTTRMVDYAISGAVIGAAVRIKLGPPGIIVGGALGGILGLFSGLANETMLSLFGASYDDVISAQYKIDRERTMLFEEYIAKESEKSGTVPKMAAEMLRSHESDGKDL